MAIYRPGTGETDPKKQNMSLQAIAAAAEQAITDIATNTANIATNTALLAALTGSKITASLGADVALSNTGLYFDGPSIAQGSTGIWSVSGTVTLTDTAGAAHFDCKLWDGTTVIASTRQIAPSVNQFVHVTLSGYLAIPAGNLRISCKDITSTSGKIIFNQTGLSKDSTISAYRIA